MYSLDEALKLATETSPVKFDASVEIHIRLGVDPRQADQNIRSTVALPHGTGKDVRVAVFAPESEHAAAKKSWRWHHGDEEFLSQLDKEELNFDILVATPQYMPKLVNNARLLGPRGLMPNPKSGTVATASLKLFLKQKPEKLNIVLISKPSSSCQSAKYHSALKISRNARAFLTSLNSQKPSSLKGVYVKSVAIATTMGPGIKVENSL